MKHSHASTCCAFSIVKSQKWGWQIKKISISRCQLIAKWTIQDVSPKSPKVKQNWVSLFCHMCSMFHHVDVVFKIVGLSILPSFQVWQLLVFSQPCLDPWYNCDGCGIVMHCDGCGKKNIRWNKEMFIRSLDKNHSKNCGSLEVLVAMINGWWNAVLLCHQSISTWHNFMTATLQDLVSLNHKS